MFRKNKKSESAFTATPSVDPLSSNYLNYLNLNSCDLAQSEGVLRKLETHIDCGMSPGFVPMYDPVESTLAPTKTYTEERTVSPEHLRMLEEVHAVVCTRLDLAESIVELTNALDSMDCPTDDCKSCKYFRPGGVDFCNTNLRIAEFLVINGIVNVFRVPGLDKPE